MVVVSARLQHSPLEMDCLFCAHWDLSLLEGSSRQLKSGTVASKVRGGL